MTKRDLCRAYRKKDMKMPTLKLARIIYDDNKLLFKNVEDARSTLRTIEGKHGGKAHISKKDIDEGFVMKEERPRNPYKIPESDETKYEPFKITGHKRIGIFSDIHVPYHNVDCLSAAITFC